MLELTIFLTMHVGSTYIAFGLCYVKNTTDFRIGLNYILFYFIMYIAHQCEVKHKHLSWVKPIEYHVV